MINTRYVLPASIAAGAHLALLLAFPIIRPPLTGTPAQPPVKTVIHEVPTDIFTPPPPPAEPGVDPVKPLKGSEESAPLLPDMPPVTQGNYPVPFDPAPSIPIKVGYTLPKGPIGTPDGVESGTPGPLPRIANPGELDAAPRARVQPAPVYPFAMRQAGVQGSATIHFIVDQAGRVVSADLVTATHREFGEAAVRAVRQWRFEPGRRHGRAVPFQMSVPVQFSLDDF